MTHYICTGGCNGVSDKPRPLHTNGESIFPNNLHSPSMDKGRGKPGVCQDVNCPKHGKPLDECGCADNKHESLAEAKQEPTVSFDDFAKVHLKAVKILEAERVEGSEKLLKLQVDLGTQRRQIVAGIGKAYAPENLIGKQIIIVANLAPRKLMGLESQGMVLAAGSEDGPVLLIPDKDVAPGSSIS